MPATPRQVRQVETVRDLIWRFYKALKAFRQGPDARYAAGLAVRFNRIFAIRTGYDDLDMRLSRRKAELLRVLDRPEIPLQPTLRKMTCAVLSSNERSPAAQ